MAIIPYQPELRPALPVVFGAKDYQEFRAALVEMDRILTVTGQEDRFIARHMEGADHLSPAQAQQRAGTLRKALRHCILLGVSGLSYRALSERIADSQLFQWFTHTGNLDAVRPASKSAIERFEKMFSSEEIAALIHELNQAVGDEEAVQELLYRETALRFDEVFADTTCVRANIHFPVDWVLLRDASRTLIKAIILIRKRGLKHRIGPPEQLASKMNKLCMEMTHIRRKPDAPKVRKRILRRMKKLMKTIEAHARTYHALLTQRWGETGWSEPEVQVVLERIQGVLDQLPQAIHQAHERIIGKRRVRNGDKILSLYEPDVHVLVRGKAGAEVEFGNGLYLAEQSDGLIVDWEFIQDQPPTDSKLVQSSLERIESRYGSPASYTADRGFDNQRNRIALEEGAVFNAICPRSVPMLEQKREDERFCALQKRRAATEGRIGLFKNAYLGKPLRSKGFKNRKTRIEWCILAHNLWKLARMAAQARQDKPSGLAKAS